MIEPKKLFLLDAMALIYRAYYALNKNPRINSKGLNTSAIVGFANALYDILKKENPTHIGVAFDTMAPTVRHDSFIQYKANREDTPEDIITSISYIKRLIEAFNIPILYLDGYEADDVIGTFAKKAEQLGFTTYMMTPDKDFGQLVSDKIFMYKPAKFGDKAEVWGVKEVCNRFGIKRPEQVIDMLGLWGDASDNIPGIPGVGEVTAKKLLEEFDSIENLIENSDQIKNEKVKLKVKEFAQQAMLSKQLATIILDVPIEFVEENLKVKPPNEKVLRELLNELEFRNFAKRVFTDLSLNEAPSPSIQMDLFGEPVGGAKTNEIPEAEPPFEARKTIADITHTYHLIDTSSKRAELIDKLKKQKSFCFDTETTGLDLIYAELVGISFAFQPQEAYYVSIPENNKEAISIINEFKTILEDKTIEKIGHNLKFDISILKKYGIMVNNNLFDTMLAHYLLQPDMRHNMDLLSETYLNYIPVSIETLIGKKGKNHSNMRFANIDDVKEYAAEDADVTFQLKNIFEPLLNSTNTRKLFNEIEIPLIHVLSSMEFEGVRIDIAALNEYSKQLQSEIKQLEIDIYQLAGINFNIASPKQLGEILFERLKIVENAKVTKTKQYSTGEEVLVKLKGKHEIIDKILDYRSLTKLKSTYVDALPLMVNPITNRIHTSYNQAVASTGRLSSNNPNLQNIPIRTEKGREIRKSFVPRTEDYVLLSADYSQIELRIIAELSNDEAMIEAFINGLDIHTATAAKVYGVALNEVTKEMRRNAKTVNFGIIYGISAFGLSERLSIPRKEAKEIIDQYFNKYPAIKAYMDNTILFARENGYVETMMDRKRYLSDINSSNAIVRGYAERNAINAPVQGTAADMIKIAMIRIFDELKEKELKSKMILQVHDELIFDVFKEEIDIIKLIVEKNMKNAIKMKVPIEIEMKTGENWLEAH
ncbi:MAG: DNA polymerase I [Bacteroidetes bacterium CG2_30_32_10]|nr:MAG: DNA polymerase I [Bacteroidetes bacterium CG2_30_32_10]